jgi:hypothetical protein
MAAKPLVMIQPEVARVSGEEEHGSQSLLTPDL